MRVPRLGNLTAHSDIPEWLVSEPIAVPYFDGLELPFTVDGLDDSDEADVVAAVDSFLNLSASDRLAASRYVYQNYLRIAEIADAEDLGCEIASASDVWNHVRASAIYVTRRGRRDLAIYVQIAADCDWEGEHGLQIVFRHGRQLSRVSAHDGHLTHTDAYDLPEDQDRIVS
jgi:hypothetical protein